MGDELETDKQKQGVSVYENYYIRLAVVLFGIYLVYYFVSPYQSCLRGYDVEFFDSPSRAVGHRCTGSTSW